MDPQRPPTTQMLNTLYKCYKREIAGKVANPFSTKGCRGLLIRGMLEVLPYSKGGKLKDALYLTRIGREAIEPIIKQS